MSDGEDGNLVNLHLSQNGQDGEVGGKSGPKNQNERKRKTPDEAFSDHKDNSSSERNIRKSKNQRRRRRSHQRCITGGRGKGQVTHQDPYQAYHQLHHLVWIYLQMMRRREVNLNLRNIKQAI